MPRVLYERDGRIARVTLNRPDAMNAIDLELPGELAAAIEQANADPKIHVIVLAGAGKAFCAGSIFRCSRKATARTPACRRCRGIR